MITASAQAEHWMSMILKAGVEANTISYNTVIKACAASRNVAKAEHGMSRMLKAVVEAETTKTKSNVVVVLVVLVVFFVVDVVVLP